jgi:hypothetical protein
MYLESVFNTVSRSEGVELEYERTDYEVASTAICRVLAAYLVVILDASYLGASG